MLESSNGFLELSAEAGTPENTDLEFIKDIHVLNSRTEVLSFLQKMLPQSGNILRMATEEIPEAMVELLALYLNRSGMRCEHLFSLKTIREQGGSLYNLQYINRIMPLISSGKEYYEENGNAMFSNWLICDRWAVGLQTDMESGLVIWNREQLEYLIKKFERKKKNKRQLLRYFVDVNQWAEWLSENRRRYLVEMESSNLRPQGVKNYYMEYGPCFLKLLTEDLLNRHLILDEAGKAMMIESWKMRRAQMDQEKAVRFFTREGLEYVL